MGQLISSAILVVFVGSALVYGGHETSLSNETSEMNECVDPSVESNQEYWMVIPSDTTGCALLDRSPMIDWVKWSRISWVVAWQYHPALRRPIGNRRFHTVNQGVPRNKSKPILIGFRQFAPLPFNLACTIAFMKSKYGTHVQALQEEDRKGKVTGTIR